MNLWIYFLKASGLDSNIQSQDNIIEIPHQGFVWLGDFREERKWRKEKWGKK